MNVKFAIAAAMAVSLLGASAFAQQKVRPPVASSITNARVTSNWVAPVEDRSKYVTRVEAGQLILESNNSALGNRIGVFQVSANSNSDQSSYIRSKLCILSTARTNDNETVTVVTPVAGPFSDGTMVWRIAAHYRPDDTRANCYFNGNPGIFNAVGFQNSDNVATTTYRNNSCNGYYCSDRTVTTQLSFTTGEANLIGDSFSPPENRQCEVAPQSCAPAEQPVDPNNGNG